MDFARMREARLPIRDRRPSFFRAAVAGAAVLAAAALAGCSSDSDELPYEERPVEQIYNTAMDHMDEKEYTPAAKEFDEVERQHPYSEWARRSMLMGAHAHYKINEYDEAILSAQRFISLHPSNKDVPYAYYLIGLSYYERISDVGRDQKMTENALQALRLVIERYPDSPYATSAILKFDLAFDHLAGKEMEIGRYYLRRGHYTAAINRFRVVVEEFQTTSHTPEALHRLVEAYLSLGLTDDAQTAAAILGYNFQSSPFYDDSFRLLTGRGLEPQENKDSWISRAWNTVF